MGRRSRSLRARALLTLAALAAGGGSQAFGVHGCASHTADAAGAYASAAGVYASAASAYASAPGGSHVPSGSHAPGGSHAPSGGHVPGGRQGSHHVPAAVPKSDGPAAHTHLPAAAASDAAADPAHPQSGVCTCLGTCHGSSQETLAVAAPAAPAPEVIVGVVERPAGRRASIRRPAFLLPYSTAPPSLG